MAGAQLARCEGRTFRLGVLPRSSHRGVLYRLIRVAVLAPGGECSFCVSDRLCRFAEKERRLEVFVSCKPRGPRDHALRLTSRSGRAGLRLRVATNNSKIASLRACERLAAQSCLLDRSLSVGDF
jgi:hypothetical protein